MSAPTPAPGDDRPREGYYPDPSIPGYVRYWNGAAWVPGTSRPAPSAGEALTPPAAARAVHVPAPASSPEFSASRGQTAVPATEETGPHFFDEDPQPHGAAPAASQHGSRPEPAASWGADRSRQSGFGGDQDRRVSWGAPKETDARDPRAEGPADTVSPPDGASARTDGTTTIPPADSGDTVRPAGPRVFRRPTGAVPSTGPEHAEGVGGAGSTSRTGEAGSGGADVWDGIGTGTAAGAGQFGAGRPTAVPGAPDPVPAGGDTAFRAPSPRTEQQGGSTGSAGAPGVSAASGPTAAPGSSSPSAASAGSGFGPAAGARSAAAQAAPAASPQPSSSTPVASGAGGGQPSWAQQVHQLAGDPAEEGQRVPAPWKPPAEDPFQEAARRQAAARPSGLGRRLAARLMDTVVIAGVTAAAAVPLGTRAVDHIDEKIDAAKLSGEKVTVWLLDGTTASCLGAVLAVLLVFGVLYEVLPTVRWGRTLGKKLCGIEVRDIEGHEPPSFGRALVRWLVLTVPCLLFFGLAGVLWCLFDKPWNQCWHDKAAHTFVAGPAR